MTETIEFAILPIVRLRRHERTERPRVDEVRLDILRRGVVDEPVLVARGSLVVLNGHHRLAALRALGARRAPVYLVDYADGAITLDRWTTGPSIAKADVVRRALAGRLYPPKTTRHTLALALPPRPTAVRELVPPAPSVPRGPAAARRRSRARPAKRTGAATRGSRTGGSPRRRAPARRGGPAP
ncbi:MAG TPA: ParB N-terminal domain-containing protein [Thermoplasmata archaeon]|nr:ParB N-terminal domain-containing protein [Thermoplasmata archaeon]